MDRFLRPERFDTDYNTQDSADTWFCTFTNFLESIGPHSPDKLKTLFNYVSPSVYRFIKDCKYYESAIETLREIYVQPKNVFARHLLNTCKQEGAQNQPWTQLDHVAISHRWRATIQDCRSFWGTPLDSDHAMVRARLTVRFPSGPRKSARNVPIHYLRRTAIAQQYRSELAQQLSTVKQYCGGSEHVDEAWQNQQPESNADSFIKPELSDSASESEMSNSSEHPLVIQQQRTRPYVLRNREA
ncbi:hypothetical protein T265_03992 [Opisthorchis viverrini]|uniref:Endonuclease/exonuclease/phosphatase domain-containing protein n=1 Tax=Opisthorchis viverrini TaxID=6198 RepID=A0A074ZUA4_OPIVI|nr:hypothetical protein T265_03992 [Opisthorchis viverrini]KER29427.1 hypothetical protein T265_03992 [Opisthorchis viverrini]